MLKDEIRQNRLSGLQFIRSMQKTFRSNRRDRNKRCDTISFKSRTKYDQKAKSEGMLEADEAGRMIIAVEERMKEVMESSLELRLPEPEEVLREVN